MVPTQGIGVTTRKSSRKRKNHNYQHLNHGLDDGKHGSDSEYVSSSDEETQVETVKNLRYKNKGIIANLVLATMHNWIKRYDAMEVKRLCMQHFDQNSTEDF